MKKIKLVIAVTFFLVWILVMPVNAGLEVGWEEINYNSDGSVNVCVGGEKEGFSGRVRNHNNHPRGPKRKANRPHFAALEPRFFASVTTNIIIAMPTTKAIKPKKSSIAISCVFFKRLQGK